MIRRKPIYRKLAAVILAVLLLFGEGTSAGILSRILPEAAVAASGADTASVRITVTAARSGLKYRCCVTSSSGASAVSDPAVLRMKQVKGDANLDGMQTATATAS